MKIGLIDVDGHNFPNLALMRISQFHKQNGDEVEWYEGEVFYYDVIYKSKVFSDAYTKDTPDPLNCGKIIKGGTGYQIKTIGGEEVYDKETDHQLPVEIERCKPDYSIYPKYDFAVAMTSRGCPRGCKFCHIAAKEGRCSRMVADVSDFWIGQGDIKVLDANLTACGDKRELFRQYRKTGARIDFTQGLDIRLINGHDIDDLKRTKVKQIHFAWDDPRENLQNYFEKYAKANIKDKHGRFGSVYVLSNYKDYTVDSTLDRVYALRDLGFDPYVMIYDKPNADPIYKRIQRWCNNKIIFAKCKRFEDYEDAGITMTAFTGVR